SGICSWRPEGDDCCIGCHSCDPQTVVCCRRYDPSASSPVPIGVVGGRIEEKGLALNHAPDQVLVRAIDTAIDKPNLYTPTGGSQPSRSNVYRGVPLVSPKT